MYLESFKRFEEGGESAGWFGGTWECSSGIYCTSFSSAEFRSRVNISCVPRVVPGDSRTPGEWVAADGWCAVISMCATMASTLKLVVQ